MRSYSNEKVAAPSNTADGATAPIPARDRRTDVTPVPLPWQPETLNHRSTYLRHGEVEILSRLSSNVNGISSSSTRDSGRTLCLKVVCWGKKELLDKSPRSQLCLKVVCWGKKELLDKSPRSQLCLKVVC
uniref:Uncharacterized protein n=1 Tax=Timema monikensis TaxID=170555 RepID=A0A7R9HQ07_9NEOP|nr:unnamed protein product [Timema monikensis]